MRQAWGIAAAFLMLNGPWGTAWADEPAPAPSLDPAFLSLPAVDLERVPEPKPQKKSDAKDDGLGQPAAEAPVLVGDSVLVRIPGLDPTQRLAVPNGGEPLADQGWDLNFESVPAVPGELRLRLTPLKAGKLTLPSLAVVPAPAPSGAPEAEPTPSARTNPFTIDVGSVIKPDDPKPDQAADLRPPVSLRFPWWAVALAAVALAALVGGLIYAYRRWARRKPKPVAVAPAPPPKPEDEVALAAFAELEQGGPLSRGEFKKHYFRVSEILKAYLGARYRFDASESTSREMISLLEKQCVWTDAQMDRLESLFEKLDLVKFTDHVPLPDEGMRLLGIAKEIVLTTRRLPEPPATGYNPHAPRTEVASGGAKR